MNQVVTCVYCGHQYPDGTPTHQAELLTEHIKTCDKHPMREAEAKILRLRRALAGIIGASTPEDLKNMEAGINLLPLPDRERATMLNGIHTLQDIPDPDPSQPLIA